MGETNRRNFAPVKARWVLLIELIDLRNYQIVIYVKALGGVILCNR